MDKRPFSESVDMSINGHSDVTEHFSNLLSSQNYLGANTK